METTIHGISVAADEFTGGTAIPERFTCKGRNISPAIRIGLLPENTRSLAIIVEDPDAPNGVFDHWIAWNIEPAAVIPEQYAGGVQGLNSKGKRGYTGPCPPMGRHRYYFKVYALDTMLDLSPDIDKKSLIHAMQEHLLGGGECMGYFENNRFSL